MVLSLCASTPVSLSTLSSPVLGCDAARPKGINWPTFHVGTKLLTKRDEKLWLQSLSCPGNNSLGPGLSSGPEHGVYACYCGALRPYPGPLPLEETVTLLRPVSKTKAGSTPPSLSLHQDVGKKPRRPVPGDPSWCIPTSRTPR